MKEAMAAVIVGLLIAVVALTYAAPNFEAHKAGVCDSCKRPVAATGAVVSTHNDYYGAKCWTSGTRTNEYMTLLNARFKAAKDRPMPVTTNKVVSRHKYNPKTRTN